jgi:predicted ATPase
MFTDDRVQRRRRCCNLDEDVSLPREQNMKIGNLRLVGIRCFEDTGDINFDRRCNIIVGRNNAGKSTVLKALLGLQGFPFDGHDLRPGEIAAAYITVQIDDIIPTSPIGNINRNVSDKSIRVISQFKGVSPEYQGSTSAQLNPGHPLFTSTRPSHTIVPFLAKRKALSFDHNISLSPQSQLNGTLQSLYSRIDLLATYGHPDHGRFCDAVLKIVGLPITMRASPNGKEAGFYFDSDNFVTLERMGDGVSEMVALIVELCVERNKIFILEEPETNLHPKGLKALLEMIRIASQQNQFFVATHSNVVVRELGSMKDGKVFRVYRDGDSYTSPSKVEEVERTPHAHMELLRDLGYEFMDFNLHEAWLFLEESSAESVFRDVLIPFFAPDLRGRLRTYSAGGATNLEPSVSEFQRLVVFVHLQPAYQNRIWIRADGDEKGVEVVNKLKSTFPRLNQEALRTFEKAQFEYYYPQCFHKAVASVLAIKDKNVRRKKKAELLQGVLDWTESNKDEARAAWSVSANEQIELIQTIRAKILTD